MTQAGGTGALENSYPIFSLLLSGQALKNTAKRLINFLKGNLLGTVPTGPGAKRAKKSKKQNRVKVETD